MHLMVEEHIVTIWFWTKRILSNQHRMNSFMCAYRMSHRSAQVDNTTGSVINKISLNVKLYFICIIQSYKFFQVVNVTAL